MKMIATSVLLVIGWISVGAQRVQLAPPIVDYESVFFSGQASIDMKFKMHGSSIRYTTDGSEPSEHSSEYTGPFTISNSLTTVSARTFGEGFKASDAVRVTFIADGLKLQTATFPDPDKRFPGNGQTTLFDNKGGVPGIGHKNWLGFRDDTVTISIRLQNQQLVSKVLVDLLQDHGSWVFLPQKIAVMYFDSTSGTFRPFASTENISNSVVHGTSCEYQVLESATPVITDKLELKLQVLQSLPDAHPGKGTKSWIFIDEIKVY